MSNERYISKSYSMQKIELEETCVFLTLLFITLIILLIYIITVLCFVVFIL